MWRFVFTVLSALVVTNEAVAVLGVCGNRQLPSDKVRKVRNIRLLCAARTSHFIRTPAAWSPENWDKWRDLEVRGTPEAQKKMQAIGQLLPLIEWTGTIPYATTEAWDWVELVLGPDPSCGYTTKTHTRTVQENGKSKQETYTTEEMNTCLHDEDRSESRFCSEEIMTFESKFERPTLASWSTTSDGYFDVIPNKYDLLPGEVEDIQISNSSSNGTQITPTVDVGDAWNKYSADINLRGYGASAACRYQQTYHLTVNLRTEERLKKRGPNAFRMPVDEFGRETEPLDWNTAEGRDKKWHRTMPIKVKLTDASETVISALSRHTRDFGDTAEAERVEAGGGQSSSKKAHRDSVAKSPFWKDTQVRVVLYKLRPWNRSIRVTERLYVRGADVASAGNYDIPLTGADQEKNMFRSAGPWFPGFWRGIFAGLEPGESYQFRVAMYNKGVPFYAQDCSHPAYRNHWNCRLGLRGEDNWFSKPLDLNFTAEKNIADQRPAIQRFADFQRKPLWKTIRDLFW